MKQSDLNLNAIRRAVAAMPKTFATFDVIEHPEMERQNSRFKGERNYRAEVGKQLKAIMGELRIFEKQPGTSRGSIWQKRDA